MRSPRTWFPVVDTLPLKVIVRSTRSAGRLASRFFRSHSPLLSIFARETIRLASPFFSFPGYSRATFDSPNDVLSASDRAIRLSFVCCLRGIAVRRVPLTTVIENYFCTADLSHRLCTTRALDVPVYFFSPRCCILGSFRLSQTRSLPPHASFPPLDDNAMHS